MRYWITLVSQAVNTMTKDSLQNGENNDREKCSYIPNMYNRITTEGKFGIWGHDLGDLILHTVWIDNDNVITLGVDS